jgi:hypothetical protein
MYKYFIAGVIVAMTSTNCLAASEFYVVKEAKGRGCDITQKKPEDASNIVGTKTYASRQEAKDAKRAAPECVDTTEKGGGEKAGGPQGGGATK